MSGQIAAIQLIDGNNAHLGDVGRLMRAAFEPRYGEAWTPTQVSGMMTLPGVFLTLAILDGDIAGFALTRMIVDEAELLLLAVDPVIRQRGVGTALLRSVIVRAKDRNITRLHLEVRANNPAIALYQRQGFEAVGIRPDYYRGSTGQLYDACSFSLDLIQKGDIERNSSCV